MSTSAIFIDLSGTSPGTASFYRCLLALPLLLPLFVIERRREGPPNWHRVGIAIVAGALFAGDALLWTQAIYEVGAGLSTVLVNAQVFIVPILALLIDHEPVTRRFIAALPIIIGGVLLTGGIFETGASGTAPVSGTAHAILAALCYSGFLFLLRRGGQAGWVVQSYWWVVASAAVVSLAAGALWQGVTLAPGWHAIAWLALTAICGQVLGWLLVAFASPRLSSTAGAVLLLLTPVGSLALAAVVLNEWPSPLQTIGCVLVLASAYVASTTSRTKNRRATRPIPTGNHNRIRALPRNSAKDRKQR